MAACAPVPYFPKPGSPSMRVGLEHIDALGEHEIGGGAGDSTPLRLTP
jgi:hypothetical protein